MSNGCDAYVTVGVIVTATDSDDDTDVFNCMVCGTGQIWEGDFFLIKRKSKVETVLGKYSYFVNLILTRNNPV